VSGTSPPSHKNVNLRNVYKQWNENNVSHVIYNFCCVVMNLNMMALIYWICNDWLILTSKTRIVTEYTCIHDFESWNSKRNKDWTVEEESANIVTIDGEEITWQWAYVFE
jgi:hypothetical protein